MATVTSKFPLNRVIAFAGPYIAILSGALADWLLVHVHLLELFHTTKTQVAGAITQLTVFGLTALLTWLGQQKWLDGWQKFEGQVAGEEANGPEPPLDEHPADLGDYDPELAAAEIEAEPEPVVGPEIVEPVEIVEAEGPITPPPPGPPPSPPPTPPPPPPGPRRKR
jgi:hypothetical protein